MQETPMILVIALIILLYGLFSKKLEQFYISGPMIFLFVGIGISPLGLGLSDLSLDAKIVRDMAELALILVLFTDSAAIKLSSFKNKWRISARLLAVGLTLTIFFSSVTALLFFPDEPYLNLLLMALILAPTDAALGKAVVSDKSMPEDIRVNINVESGLNDGIVFPLLVTTVLLILSQQSIMENHDWLPFLLQQIAFGFLFGALLGYIGAKLLEYDLKQGWIEETYRNLIPVALALLSFESYTLQNASCGSEFSWARTQSTE